MKYINQKRQLTYLMAAVSIVQFFYSLPNTTIPLFVLEMGGGEAEVGLIGGIISVGALLFRGIIGYITDVKGRRIVYLAGVIIYAATTFGYAVSPNIAFLMVFKAVSGVGLCAVTSGACAIIADLSGKNATRGLTALMTVQMVAGLFAPTLGMALGEIIGYRLLYTFSAIGFLPAVLLVMPIRYEKYLPKAPAQKPEKTKFRVTQLFEKSAAAPAVCTAFLGITVCSVTNFIASYGKTISVNNTGFFFIVNGLMTLAVFPALKKFSQRKYNNRVFVLGVAAFLVSLGCLLVTRGAPLIAVSAGFYSVGYAACQPILNALALSKALPERKGAANATCYIAWDIGFGIGSALLGMLATGFGYGSIFLVAMACALVMAGIYGLYQKRQPANE